MHPHDPYLHRNGGVPPLPHHPHPHHPHHPPPHSHPLPPPHLAAHSAMMHHFDRLHHLPPPPPNMPFLSPPTGFPFPPPPLHHRLPPPHAVPPPPFMPLPSPPIPSLPHPMHLAPPPPVLAPAPPPALPMPPPPRSLPLPPPPPQSLPLPPPPPAAAAASASPATKSASTPTTRGSATSSSSSPSASPPAVSSVWIVYQTPAPELTEYYFNTVTQETTWTKPIELQSAEERAIPACAWTEFRTPTGETYYAHPTELTTWTKPEAYIEWEIRTKAAANAKAKRDKAKKANAPTVTNSNSTAASSTAEPNYSSKEEARAAFRSLLVDKRVTTRMNFTTDVLPLISSDMRYRALKSAPERKKVYERYIEDLLKTEVEQRQQKRQEVLADFNRLLSETTEITYKSKYKTMLPILELDQRYKALHEDLIAERILHGSTLPAVYTLAVSEKIEEIFYGYVDQLIAAEKRKEEAERMKLEERFKELMKEYTVEEAMTEIEKEPVQEEEDGEVSDDTFETVAVPSASSSSSTAPVVRFITSSTSYRHIKKHAELTADQRWLDITNDDERHDLVDAWISKLKKIQREKDEKKREERKQIEKKLKGEFTELLKERSQQLQIHSRSVWRDVIDLLKDEQRYQALVQFYNDSSSSSASSSSRHPHFADSRLKDIFHEFTADLSDRLSSTRKTLESTIIKDLSISIQPDSTPDSLSLQCAKHASWSTFTSSVTPIDLSLIWLSLIAKTRERIEYFHSRQKPDAFKAVARVLTDWWMKEGSRGQQKDRIEDEEMKSNDTETNSSLNDVSSVTYEQCEQMMRQLSEPILVVPESAPANEVEDGEIEEGEVPATVAPVLLPRQHPPLIQSGLDAWHLLAHPPLPIPLSDSTIYTREAVDVWRREFGMKRKDDDGMEDESERKESTKSRKRARSSSSSQHRSRSSSRSSSHSSSSSSSSSSASRSRSRSRSNDNRKKTKYEEVTSTKLATTTMSDVEEGEA